MPRFHASKTIIFNLYINYRINTQHEKIQAVQNDTKMKGKSSTIPSVIVPTTDYLQPFVFSFGGYLNKPKSNTFPSTPSFSSG